MPRFPVAFNRRKSTADNLDNVPVAAPSFRVLDRTEVLAGAKNFDASPGPRSAVKSRSMPNTLMMADDDDNMFTNVNINRYAPDASKIRKHKLATTKFTDKERCGSSSSNTTKTVSDNSSRHSNASTTPSSADLNAQQQHKNSQLPHVSQEEWRLQNKKLYGDVPVPPIPKSNTTGNFLKSAGRTFSFGGLKKSLPMAPDEKPPPTPPTYMQSSSASRDRAISASTVTTTTPPKLEEQFALDLGGDFSKMLGGFDKRASVATLGNSEGRPALVPRSLTGNRLNQPTPIPLDNTTKIDPSPFSWDSQHSNEQLLSNEPADSEANENAPPVPPPVPRHASPLRSRPLTASAVTPAPAIHSLPHIPSSAEPGLKRTSAIFGRRRSTMDNSTEPADDEGSVLLKDSYSIVNRFLEGSAAPSVKPASSSTNRFGRRNDNVLNVGYSQVPTESTSPTIGDVAVTGDDNLFDNSVAQSSKPAERFVPSRPSPPRNKVMTPAQFERYRKDKERLGVNGFADETKLKSANEDDEDDDNYEDDVDEAEKSRQAAKQRRKQEAHMAVYRQQMMKVTGEAASGTPARASIQFSLSTPNLPSFSGPSAATAAAAGAGAVQQAGSDGEDEDEEIPLAILAAHGFPNRSRPPTRLSTMMSNPNLRAAGAPSYQRPQSVIGADMGGANTAAAGGRLPVFARNLPQDPYGLVNGNSREPANFAGGAPAASGSLPPGGLVGVIASEERSRAMRRGSPSLDVVNKPLPPQMAPGPQFDPVAGIPPHMMYPGMGYPQQMLTPGDQAQIQMTQQMQQFMQMQMQFMQMMAANNGVNGMQRPSSQYGGFGLPQSNMGMGGMDNMGGIGGVGGMGMGMGNPDMMRHSFVDNGSFMDQNKPHTDMHMRSMSMVQPSSASWIQPLQNPGFAPSIRINGVNGYAPSIAPSERSNVGLPGRYRPVSHMPTGPNPSELRKSMNLSGALGINAGDDQDSGSPHLDPIRSDSTSPNEANMATGRGPSPTGWDFSRKQKNRSPLAKASTAADDDDDEEGWAAMKAKRDKKRSTWRARKTLSSDIGALII